MSDPGRQAPHRPGRFALRLLPLLLLAGLVGFAWRLAQAPLPLPMLARVLEQRAEDAVPGLRLRVGGAALGWQGFHRGFGAPLDIRLTDIRIEAGPDGAELAIPAAEIALSVPWLLGGQLTPAGIVLHRPRLRAVLGPDGRLSLGPLGAEGEPTAPSRVDPLAALTVLLHPAHDGGRLVALRRVAIEGGEAVLYDPKLGREWAVLEPNIALRRTLAGGLSATGRAVVRAGGVSVLVDLSGTATGTPMQFDGRLRLPALRPAALGAIWPGLAPLNVLDADVALEASGRFDADLRPMRIEARLRSGPGTLALGPADPGATPARLRLQGFEATLEGSARNLQIRAARLLLPGRAGRPGLELAAQLQGARQPDGAWQAEAQASSPAFPLADLAAAWPAELLPPLRAQALEALAGGTLGPIRATLGFSVSPQRDRVELKASQIALSGRDLVLALGKDAKARVAELDLAARFDAETLRIERLALVLPKPRASDGEAPRIAATAEARRRGQRWQVTAEASLDQVDVRDAAEYWPPGVVDGTAREWVIENITAGVLRDGRWQASASLPDSLDAIDVTALSGTARYEGGTVHWLRPVPPLTDVSGDAEFRLREIFVRGHGGRQLGADGLPSGLAVPEGTVRLYNFHIRPGNIELRGRMTGPLTDAVALLRHTRLKLFDKRELPFTPAAGQVAGTLTIGFPLWADLPMEQLQVRGTTKVTGGRLPGALAGQDLDRAEVEIAVSTEGLKAKGQAVFLDAPVQLTTEMDFRAGPPSQVLERASLAGPIEVARLAALGLDAGDMLGGRLGIEARVERRRDGAAALRLKADLREAALGGAGLGWQKPPGAPASAEAVLRLQGETLRAAETLRLEAPGLLLRGGARFGDNGRLASAEITEGRFAEGRFTASLAAPVAAGGPWRLAAQGPVLDLGPLQTPAARQAREAASDRPQPPLAAQLRFARVLLGQGRAVQDIAGAVEMDAAGLLRQAALEGRTRAGDEGAFRLRLEPEGTARALSLQAGDAGALFEALDLTDIIRGGRLTVAARYAGAQPGAALAGTAELEGFALRNAPAAAKLLQIASVYGIPAAIAEGRDLGFRRLIAPFSLTPDALTLTDTRAFSAALGFTTEGTVWRRQQRLDLNGTIVPSYLLNTLPGEVPILGKLFSPEKGGGLFAATWRLQGPIADPAVSVNPLAALTPGALRGLFRLAP